MLKQLSITAAVTLPLVLLAAAPEGWLLTGSKPADYDTGVDRQAIYNNLPSAYLKAKDGIDINANAFGTLMQQFAATNYVGKRVRLSGFVKASNVNQWSGLWMRIDGPRAANGAPEPLGFDNMQNRAIKGTLDWKRYEVVLDVPEKAQTIAFGILLAGGGEVWLNGTKVEVVSTSTPTTVTPQPPPNTEPKNLTFQ